MGRRKGSINLSTFLKRIYEYERHSRGRTPDGRFAPGNKIGNVSQSISTQEIRKSRAMIAQNLPNYIRRLNDIIFGKITTNECSLTALLMAIKTCLPPLKSEACFNFPLLDAQLDIVKQTLVRLSRNEITIDEACKIIDDLKSNKDFTETESSFGN